MQIFFLPQTMTTPNKARYQLRNRIILAPGSGEAPIANLNLDDSVSEEMLSDMQPPPEMADERALALAEEIKKLQEENRTLKSQQENKDSEVISLMEKISGLDTQRGQLESILEKERQENGIRATELSTLLEEKQSLDERCRILEEEATDLRVMSAYSEKTQAEEKKKQEEWVQEKNKEIASFETKVG